MADALTSSVIGLRLQEAMRSRLERRVGRQEEAPELADAGPVPGSEAHRALVTAARGLLLRFGPAALSEGEGDREPVQLDLDLRLGFPGTRTRVRLPRGVELVANFAEEWVDHGLAENAVDFASLVLRQEFQRRRQSVRRSREHCATVAKTADGTLHIRSYVTASHALVRRHLALHRVEAARALVGLISDPSASRVGRLVGAIAHVAAAGELLALYGEADTVRHILGLGTLSAAADARHSGDFPRLRWHRQVRTLDSAERFTAFVAQNHFNASARRFLSWALDPAEAVWRSSHVAAA